MHEISNVCRALKLSGTHARLKSAIACLRLAAQD
jgi:hypothetical protein